MSRARLADATAVLAFGLTFALGIGLVAVDTRDANSDRVEIRIRYSRFEPALVDVRTGRPVTVVLRNDDPIEHEWIVGDEATHDAHRFGTEPYHDARPTEVSIPALSVVETTLTFAEPVSWRFICHLPGHEAYGMVGMLNVR